MDKPDIVFGTSTPLSVAWAAREIARFWKIPWVFEVRDLWPDFPIEMGALPIPWLQRRFRNLEHDLYRDADHVITLSPDMEQHVLRSGGSPDKVTTLLNGTSFELLDAARADASDALRRKYGLENKRVILYAGTFGRANGIPAILRAARELQSREDLVFVFVGSGYFNNEVAAEAAAAPNVVACPAVPKHEVFDWHRMADLSLVTFIDRPVLASNSPSKFFDSLAAGTPVLVTNPGWTRRFVTEHDCGWVVDRLDTGPLVSILQEIFDTPESIKEKGMKGATIARTLFDRKRMAVEVEHILDESVRLADRHD